jgi:hypothetical protein
MSFGRRLASSRFPRSRNRSRGRLLVLQFVLIVSMFSFVSANNEVSQGFVLSHSSRIAVVHGAHVAHGGSGRPVLQDRQMDARVVREHGDVRGTAEEPDVSC